MLWIEYRWKAPGFGDREMRALPPRRENDVTQPTNPLELLVGNLELRAPLTDDDRAALLSLPYRLRTLEPSSYTVREGDRPDDCFVLISGFAYRQKSTRNGARQVLAFHIPGDAVDLQHLHLDVCDHNVQMLTRGDVALVRRSAIQELARTRPGIAHAILVKVLVEGSIFREWLLNVGRRDAKTRVAHLICEFAIRLQREGLDKTYGYVLPMSQELLGDAVALTPVHVNRMIRLLEKEGYIQRKGREISFPDWEKMRRVADFSERYLHLSQQEQQGQTVTAQLAMNGSGSDLSPPKGVA